MTLSLTLPQSTDSTASEHNSQSLNLNDGNTFFASLPSEIVQHILSFMDDTSLCNLSSSSKFLARYIPEMEYSRETHNIRKFANTYLRQDPEDPGRQYYSGKIEETKKDVLCTHDWASGISLYSLRKISLTFSSFRQRLVSVDLAGVDLKEVQFYQESLDLNSLPRSLKHVFKLSIIAKTKAIVSSIQPPDVDSFRKSREITKLYVDIDQITEASNSAQGILNPYYRNSSHAYIVKKLIEKSELVFAQAHLNYISFSSLRHPLEKKLIKSLFEQKMYDQLLNLVQAMPANSNRASEAKETTALDLAIKLCLIDNPEQAERFNPYIRNQQYRLLIQKKIAEAYLKQNMFSLSSYFIRVVAATENQDSLLVEGINLAISKKDLFYAYSFCEAIQNSNLKTDQFKKLLSIYRSMGSLDYARMVEQKLETLAAEIEVVTQ